MKKINGLVITLKMVAGRRILAAERSILIRNRFGRMMVRGSVVEVKCLIRIPISAVLIRALSMVIKFVRDGGKVNLFLEFVR